MNLLTSPILTAFAKTFCATEEAWLLFDDEDMLATTASADGTTIIPVFADKKSAKVALDEWRGERLKIEGVMIDEFLFGLIPSLIEAQANFAVYPFDGEIGENVFTPRAVAKQLKTVLEAAYGERVDLPY